MSQFWTDCLARFETELPAQQFNAWIKTLRVEADEGGQRLRLIAPNGFILRWVRDRYLVRIEELARQFFQGSMNIDLIIDANPVSAIDTPELTSSIVVTSAGKSSPTAPAPLAENYPDYEKTRLNAEFTFDNLVTGRSNDLARAAAQHHPRVGL